MNTPVLCAEFTATLLVPLRDARTVEEARSILATLRTAEVFGVFEWYTLSAPRIVRETLPATLPASVITPVPNGVESRPPARSTPGRKPRSQRGARGSVEALARRHYKPGMSAGELSRAAGIGISAASKWRKVLEAEQAAQ